MKALFISNDPSIFDPTSSARERMRVYAGTIGTLYVLSRAQTHEARAYQTGVQEGGLILMAVSGGKLTSLAALLRTARRLITTEGIEIVSAQDPFEYGWIAMRAVAGTNAKLHIQVHTDFCSSWFLRSGVMRSARVAVPLLNRLRVKIADRVLTKADGIRVVSARIADALTARYGKSIASISVIPIMVSELLPSKVELPPHQFSFALLTASRLEPEKRVEDIIDALARIKDRYPAAGLIIVGDGRSRTSLVARARVHGLNDRVLFIGWRSDVLGLMQSAQAYIQASAYEGYGMTLIEAALARIPIITTDVGIVGEVFTGYEDVLVAPPGDPAALAVHIMSLIEDVQARKSLVISAERKAKEHLRQVGDQPARVAENLARTIAHV